MSSKKYYFLKDQECQIAISIVENNGLSDSYKEILINEGGLFRARIYDYLNDLNPLIVESVIDQVEMHLAGVTK